MSVELDLDDFFDHINDQFAARNGFKERIDELLQLTPGREIVRVEPNSDQWESIGYILPLTPAKKRHLILFRDGEKIVVEPDQHSTLAEFVLYLQIFHPNEESLKVNSFADLTQIRDDFFHAPNGLNCRTIFRSSNPDELAAISLAEEEAKAFEPELVRRAEARKQTDLNLLQAETAGYLRFSSAASSSEFPTSGWGN